MFFDLVVPETTYDNESKLGVTRCRRPKTHITNTEFGHTYFLVCQQTAPTSSAKIQNHCDETINVKAWATKTEHKEVERESAGFLTLMPIACCKNLAVFIVGQPMRFGGGLGGPTLPSHVFRASISFRHALAYTCLAQLPEA